MQPENDVDEFFLEWYGDGWRSVGWFVLQKNYKESRRKEHPSYHRANDS
jgi:hypothetical protein